MESNEPRSLHDRLRQALPPVEANPDFARRLRRALLSCRFYTEPRRVRLQRMLRAWAPLTLGSLALGFALAVWTGRGTPTAPPSTAPAIAAVVQPETLERLSQHNRLHYLYEQPNGIRVYRVSLDNGATIDLLDAMPYVIRLTGQP